MHTYSVDNIPLSNLLFSHLLLHYDKNSFIYPVHEFSISRDKYLLFFQGINFFISHLIYIQDIYFIFTGHIFSICRGNDFSIPTEYGFYILCTIYIKTDCQLKLPGGRNSSALL